MTLSWSYNGGADHTIPVAAGASSASVSGLVNGRTYDVRAIAHGGGTDSDTATVSATPRATNVAPKALADDVSLNGAAPVSFYVGGNDSDANNDNLDVIATTAPTSGTVSCETWGQCTYTPTSGSDPVDTDTFTYTVSDEHGGRSTATVTLHRRHYVANADQADATSVAYSAFDVLGNDTGRWATDSLQLDTTGFTLGTITVGSGADDLPEVDFTPNGGTGTQSVHYTMYDENNVELGGADLTITVHEAPQVTLTVDHPLSSVNAPVTFSGRTTPAAVGAPIELQRFSAGAWHVVQTKALAASSATQVGSGAPYSFTVRERTSGWFSYRVRLPADSGRWESVEEHAPIAMYAGLLGTVQKTANEYVVVKNSGKVAVNLKGWSITTKAGKKLTLPSKALSPGKTVKVHPGTGRTTSTDLYLRRGASFGDAHDRLTLKDSRAVVVATKSY